MDYVWDVYVPGEDLPRRLETDYLLADGDEIAVDGTWIVENVEAPREGESTGRVTVVAPREPA